MDGQQSRDVALRNDDVTAANEAMLTSEAADSDDDGDDGGDDDDAALTERELDELYQIFNEHDDEVPTSGGCESDAALTCDAIQRRLENVGIMKDLKAVSSAVFFISTKFDQQ